MRQRAFGYTDEDLKTVLSPSATQAEEPIGSMGIDTPLACLSDQPQLLFNYFKQTFAQVTNPAIDPIREGLVMSLNTYIGSEGNILDETPKNCHTLKLRHPIISNWRLEKLRRVSWGDFLATTLPMVFRVEGGEKQLEKSIENLCRSASLAIKSGYTLLILSDRAVDHEHAPIPSLLALSAVHNHLIREKTRNQVALIVEHQKGYYRSTGREYAAVTGTLRDACRRFSIDTDRVFLSGRSASAATRPGHRPGPSRSRAPRDPHLAQTPATATATGRRRAAALLFVPTAARRPQDERTTPWTSTATCDMPTTSPWSSISAAASSTSPTNPAAVRLMDHFSGKTFPRSSSAVVDAALRQLLWSVRVGRHAAQERDPAMRLAAPRGSQPAETHGRMATPTTG